MADAKQLEMDDEHLATNQSAAPPTRPHNTRRCSENSASGMQIPVAPSSALVGSLVRRPKRIGKAGGEAEIFFGPLTLHPSASMPMPANPTPKYCGEGPETAMKRGQSAAAQLIPLGVVRHSSEQVSMGCLCYVGDLCRSSLVPSPVTIVGVQPAALFVWFPVPVCWLCFAGGLGLFPADWLAGQLVERLWWLKAR